MRWAICPQSTKRIVEGAAQHHEVGAKRDGPQDVQAAVDTAVEDDGQFRGLADGWQGLDRGGGAVELAACVVADPDCIRAQLFKLGRTFGAHDAFDQQRAVPVVAQPRHVVPIGRGAQKVSDMRGRRQVALACIARSLHIFIKGPHVRHAARGHAHRPCGFERDLRQQTGRQFWWLR